MVQPLEELSNRFKYSVFISYNHQDRSAASWLHRQLEAYRIPRRLEGRSGPIGVLGRRLPPVFQDREELRSSADLADSVRQALTQSATLIVICSPAAAASRWVNEELLTFGALGRADRVQCLIVDGEPAASRRTGVDAASECFPSALLLSGREPLAADLRPTGDGPRNAKLKLIAAVLGVDFDELKQRDLIRRQQRLLVLAFSSVAGLLIASALAISALISRNEAVHERDVARRRTLTAERTATFVKSLFEVSDPSEAKGTTITAREILDRGAREIQQGLSDEPDVRASLATTLGEVYLSLGLDRDGERIIRSTFAIHDHDPLIQATQYLALGDAQTSQAEYNQALKTYYTALALARRYSSDEPGLVPSILVKLGEAQSLNGDYAKAEKPMSEALHSDLVRLGPRQPDIARDLEALGLNAFFSNRLARAKALVGQALSIREAVQGPLHPRVAEDLNLLGAAAYLQRDSRTAEQYYRRALHNDELVLGADHPDLAVTLNNLARVILERRAFKEAEPLLVRSLATTLRQRSETHDDLAFTFGNLAIVRRNLGDPGSAETLFRKAITAAEIHKHRNLAPAMSDLADLQCSRGRVGEGLALLDKARPIMARTYPDDPWRVAWVDNVRGDCLMMASRVDEAKPLILSSDPVLRARWPTGSLYGHDAQERLKRLKQTLSAQT